jgi:O-methyltransferase
VIDEQFLTAVSEQAYGWPASLRFTYDNTRRLVDAGVEGCFVECGVANGVHPAVMGKALDDANSAAKVHLFDSFQGLPHAGPNDGDFIKAGFGDGTGRLYPIDLAVCSLPDVKANLLRWLDPEAMRRFVFYPGWFQDTIKRAAPHIGPIAYLRLDGDLYESTLICLQHLEPLVVSGGLIVVDDHNLDGCRAAINDYFIREAPGSSFPEEFSAITESGDVWWTKQ